MLRPGKKVGAYTILEELRRGNKANSYKARRNDNKLIFLKQYSTPTPFLSWYDAYVSYEKEKKTRIEASDAKSFCLAPVEIFENPVGKGKELLQAFDFVEHGNDLKAILIQLKKKSVDDTWKKRLGYARVFLAALDSIAKIKLVHGDLKPENIHLIEDITIATGYRPKLIDMDASILTDKEAPWKNPPNPLEAEGFMGTENYWSPEHGSLPVPASDVFTASLIIHELICKDRPYKSYGSADEISKLLSECEAPTPELLRSIGSPSADAALRKALRAALSKKPGDRPTVGELRSALMGHTATPIIPPSPLPRICSLILLAKDGRSRKCNISTDFGKQLARTVSDHYSHIDQFQFRLVRTAPNAWCIQQVSKIVQTLVNGNPLTNQISLKSNDSISILHGNEMKPAFEIKVVIE